MIVHNIVYPNHAAWLSSNLENDGPSKIELNLHNKLPYAGQLDLMAVLSAEKTQSLQWNVFFIL